MTLVLASIAVIVVPGAMQLPPEIESPTEIPATEARVIVVFDFARLASLTT